MLLSLLGLVYILWNTDQYSNPLKNSVLMFSFTILSTYVWGLMYDIVTFSPYIVIILFFIYIIYFVFLVILYLFAIVKDDENRDSK